MKNEFIVYPAIDLRKGQIVRLSEGDPNRQTTYGNDPGQMARHWLSMGAKWLHVVNLDGAFEEKDQANKNALKAILKEAFTMKIPVQFGGGLRDLNAVEEVLNLGVTRAVLGTAAAKDPLIVKEAVKHWGTESLAVSLDARDGMVKVRGWQESSAFSALDLGKKLKTYGLEWLVFTDIARDGLQTGVNLEATVALARETGLKVIASGGISDLEDIRSVCQAGLPGVISGRALYEGKIDPQKLFNNEDPIC
ncbi:MAG: 1-(5-phosphoribosyl)-5-[(5-phosphoribosylamino)methylideneamino]imidazole-4-carboxamide isomerase [Anaerolineaceae bacterium]|nr:1-(5-phosphoribosyl)-5-[(5-phosphoribosylamino)methylideneamino]imidazole-4-carboxamide isomerase [Anaerolineaceae bacterium]